jgi:FkbM family methyltransferase
MSKLYEFTKQIVSYRYVAFLNFLRGDLSFLELTNLALPGRKRRKEVDEKIERLFWKYKNRYLEEPVLFSHPIHPVAGNIWESLETIEQIVDRDQYNTRRLIKDGDTVIDAGANIGIFAIKVSHDFPGTKIYSFEPSKETFAVLRENTKPYPNVTCVNKGLGDSESEKAMSRHVASSVGSRMDDSSMGKLPRNAAPETVSITTLDAFTAKENLQVDFIKIDTEGYEAKILTGATQTIRSFKPTVVMSAYHTAEDKEKLPELLRSICPDYLCELRHDSEEDLICKVSER